MKDSLYFLRLNREFSRGIFAMKLDAFLLLKEVDSPFLLPVVCLVRSFYLYFFFQLTDFAHSHVEELCSSLFKCYLGTESIPIILPVDEIIFLLYFGGLYFREAVNFGCI